VALLMIRGIVISLKILVIGMGNRGSKSDKDLSVKEQRVDGSSVIYFESIKYYNCKVYSSRR
jgi:hypothetical protein